MKFQTEFITVNWYYRNENFTFETKWYEGVTVKE